MSLMANPGIQREDIQRAVVSALTGNGARPRLSRQQAVTVVAFCDLAAVAASGFASALLLSNHGLQLQHALQAALVGAILTVVCLASQRAYDATRVHALPIRPKSLLTNLAIGVLPLSGLAVPSGVYSYDGLSLLLLWMLIGFAALLAVHAAARVTLRRLTARGYFDQRIAVFGAGVIARRLYDHVVAHDHGTRFCGLYDDRGADRVDSLGLTIAGKLGDLVAAAQAHRFDQIVIALPPAADLRIATIAARFANLPVSVHVVTHLASDYIEEAGSFEVSRIGPVGLLDVKSIKGGNDAASAAASLLGAAI